MRISVGALGSIVLLFLGYVAISEAGQQSHETAMNSSNTSADTWNTTTTVLDGVGQAGSIVVWGGVIAVVLVALGIAAIASRGGR